MKDYSMPFFVYAVAKPLQDFSFLGSDALHSIIKSGYAGSPNNKPEDIARAVNSELSVLRAAWTGVYKNKKVDQGRLRSVREKSGLDKVMELLERKNVNPLELDFIGEVPVPNGYGTPISVLSSKDNKVYVAQPKIVLGNTKVDILELDRLFAEQLIKNVHSFSYGRVTAALKPLLNRRNMCDYSSKTV